MSPLKRNGCVAQDALLAADGPRRLVWLLALGAPPPLLLAALGALRVFCAGAGGPRGDPGAKSGSAPTASKPPPPAPAVLQDDAAARHSGEPWADSLGFRIGSLGSEARLEALVIAGLLPAAVRLVGEAVAARGPGGPECAAGSAWGRTGTDPVGALAVAGQDLAEREAVAASALGLLGGLAGCEGMRDALRCACVSRAVSIPCLAKL